MNARTACGLAALLDSPGKRKAASPACPQGLKNRAESRPVLHNSTGPTARETWKDRKGKTTPSMKRETLIAGGTGIGGRPPFPQPYRYIPSARNFSVHSTPNAADMYFLPGVWTK